MLLLKAHIKYDILNPKDLHMANISQKYWLKDKNERIQILFGRVRIIYKNYRYHVPGI